MGQQARHRRARPSTSAPIDERDIEFALIDLNRDSPRWLVEPSGKRISPPQRGTTVALIERDRLLITGDPDVLVAEQR